MNENHNILSLSNNSKHRSDNLARSDYIQYPEFERLRGLPRTPERNVRSSSVATSSCIRDQLRSNSDQETRIQVLLVFIEAACYIVMLHSFFAVLAVSTGVFNDILNQKQFRDYSFM